MLGAAPVTALLRRARAVWAERNPFWCEVVSGFGLLCWAVMTLVGFRLLGDTPSGRVLAGLFSEELWVVLAGITGLIQLLAAWSSHREPQWLAATAGCTLWVLLAQGVASAWPGTGAPAPYIALAFGCLISILKPPSTVKRHAGR
jgi:hypothetical protein